MEGLLSVSGETAGAHAVSKETVSNTIAVGFIISSFKGLIFLSA